VTQALPRKRWHWISLAAAGGVVIALLIGWAALRAWRHVPEFYVDALAVDSQVQQRGNRGFLRKVADLASGTQSDTHWQVSFTAAEINGWLAVDLPKNHADLLPAEFSEPRVRIDDTRITIAVRHQADDDTPGNVFTVTASIFTLAPNRLAVQIHSARAGIVPLPLDGIVEAISRAGEQLDCPIVWQQSGGEPVAVIVLPTGDGDDAALAIDSLAIADDALIASGRGNHSGALDGIPEIAERITLPTDNQSGENENVQR
jgi:hypothetical protein